MKCTFCGEETELFVMRGEECITCYLDLGEAGAEVGRLLRILAARVARLEER